MIPIICFLLLSAVLYSGCAYEPIMERKQYHEEVDNHVLRVNRHGYLVDNDIVTQSFFRRDHLTPLESAEVSRLHRKILHGALLLACEKKHPTQKKVCESQLDPYLTQTRDHRVSAQLVQDAKVKILVYVHGGLNTYADTDERFERQLSLIEDQSRHGQQNPDWHYPVYVSWPSNAPGTIAEHWFSNREGRWTPWYVGYPSSPFILFEDMIGSIAEFPSNMYYQFTNDKDRFLSGGKWGLSSIWDQAHYQYENVTGLSVPVNDFSVARIGDNKNIIVNRSIYRRSNSMKRVSEAATLSILTPIRYPLGSLWNGAMANNGWDMMKRRARNVVYPTGDFQERLLKKELAGTHLGVFFESLFALQRDNPSLDIELSLVGHSMGTIIINNLLGKYQNRWTTLPLLKNIVYMAAAASIEDTLAVVPDILRGNNKIDFYNLTLNRVAEVAETYAAGIAPSGSLLVSIDKYHDAPEHHLKRTFGSEVNIQSSLPVILESFKGVADTIVLKAFDNIDYEEPLKHGSFGCIPYWKKSTWALDETHIGTSIAYNGPKICG